MIRLKNLTKRFGTTVAVDGLDLEIPRGQFFAFLGPNGAGKTTTIKMLTGLLRPTSGAASIGGHDLRKEPEAARRILGYIPDRPFLYDKLTAREFLRFTASLYRIAPAEADKRIDRWLGTFGLGDRGEAFIGSYSHGMRQKLAFSGALLHEPDVYVIDEPMVGLDPAGARLVKDILKEETAKGRTVFLSTHTLSVAEELADRIGIIHKGKLTALGSLDELRRQARAAQLGLEQLFLRLTGGTNGGTPGDDENKEAKIIRLG